MDSKESYRITPEQKEVEDKIIMTQDTSTYYVWIGGSCDYGHKERTGGAAVVIETTAASSTVM